MNIAHFCRGVFVLNWVVDFVVFMPGRKLFTSGDSVFKIIYTSRWVGHFGEYWYNLLSRYNFFLKHFSQVERRRRPSKDSESDTDSDDSDLDLDKKVKPMATYVKQRDVLVEQMFHCISKKKLKRMLPEILKVLQYMPSLKHWVLLAGCVQRDEFRHMLVKRAKLWPDRSIKNQFKVAFIKYCFRFENPNELTHSL